MTGICAHNNVGWNGYNHVTESRYCKDCGININSAEVGPGSGYYRKMKGEQWEFFSWKTLPAKARPVNRKGAVEKLSHWFFLSKGAVKYATTQCSVCYNYHNVLDWTGDICDNCKGESNMAKKPILKVHLMPAPKAEHKQGDVWKLPKGNSPLWTEQWAYQGSAKSPYIVSRKQDHKYDGVTEESWACSCMNWTRNMPRVDCKHILQIKLKEKVQATPQKIARLSNDQQAAFEKWQREQAEKGIVVGNIPEGADFTPKGRKFR